LEEMREEDGKVENAFFTLLDQRDGEEWFSVFCYG